MTDDDDERTTNDDDDVRQRCMYADNDDMPYNDDDNDIMTFDDVQMKSMYFALAYVGTLYPIVVTGIIHQHFDAED